MCVGIVRGTVFLGPMRRRQRLRQPSTNPLRALVSRSAAAVLGASPVRVGTFGHSASRLFPEGGRQWGKIGLYDVSHDFRFYAEVLVDQDVSETSYLGPGDF